VVLTTAITLFGAAGSAQARLVDPSVHAQREGSCAHAACFHLESTIAFSTTRDSIPPATTPAALNDAAEIYLMNPSTANPSPRRLTRNDVGDGFANLSPDGKHIVFDRASKGVCGGKAYNISDLYVMDADGSNQRFLTRGSSATWSPDGKDIAFHASASYYTPPIGLNSGCPLNPNPGAATSDSDIFVANVDDLLAGLEQPSNITNSDQIEDDADWSVPTAAAPDGQIVFTAHPATAYQSNQTEMYVMNPNGSGRTRLTGNNIDPRFNNIEERAPAWSPDGTRIVYSCRIGGGMNVFQICVMNADGTSAQQLTDDSVPNLSASWSPDGQEIVFNKLLPQVPGSAIRVNYQLFTMTPTLDPNGNMPTANEITCAPGQDPGYLYPCPQGVTPTAGINLLAHWGVLRVKS
jgi:Tol biopolymer transport system component